MGYYCNLENGVRGIEKAEGMLKEGGDAGDAIEAAVREVEDLSLNPSVTAAFPMRRWKWS